jgi:hypothetical protein
MPRCILILAILFAAGCRSGADAPAQAASKSPAGWEIRYNAALALAHRGSAEARDPHVWDMILEMLDEPQQMSNFTTKKSDGREVPDETAARLTVIGALKAVQALFQKQPSFDFSSLAEPLARLEKSANVPVSAEAKATRLTLFKQ